MKNAIVYGVNNNKVYVECMVNSINSLYANNSKELLDGIDLFILTTNPNIDLHELDFRAKPIIVQLDYSMFFTERAKNNKYVKRYSQGTLLRFELFKNTRFHVYDNILYLDCDTVVNEDISELFVRKNTPQILMSPGPLKFGERLLKTKLKYYCNAGVLLINPSAFGSETLNNISNNLFQYIFNLFETINVNTSTCLDQDAINLVLQNYIVPLPYKYNTRYDLDKKPKTEWGVITHHINSRGLYEKEYNLIQRNNTSIKSEKE